MALLDVSFVLDDPLFRDDMTCVRVTQTVNNHGEAEQSEESFPVSGVITDGEGALTSRDEDAERSPETLTFHTKTRLYTAREGMQPDMILFRGGKYEVKAVHNWSHFGGGYTRVELQAVTMLDTRE